MRLRRRPLDSPVTAEADWGLTIRYNCRPREHGTTNGRPRNIPITRNRRSQSSDWFQDFTDFYRFLPATGFFKSDRGDRRHRSYGIVTLR
jgi:hypothetical protein